MVTTCSLSVREGTVEHTCFYGDARNVSIRAVAGARSAKVREPKWIPGLRVFALIVIVLCSYEEFFQSYSDLPSAVVKAISLTSVLHWHGVKVKCHCVALRMPS